MTWILTRHGVRFDLLDPRPSMVDMRDVVHALSQIGRYTGHAAKIYTVAEHSCRVAALMPPGLRLAALLHDGAEAYVQDISRPLKVAMRRVSGVPKLITPYDEIERRVAAAVAERFGLSLAELEHPEVKRGDLVMLRTEWRDVMQGNDEDVAWCPDAVPARINPWKFESVKDEFERQLKEAL